jgi:hypothetical protein
MSDEQKAALIAAGREDASDRLCIPWVGRYLAPQLKVLLEKAFVRSLFLNKVETICIRCGWSQAATGTDRALQHMLGELKLQAWKEANPGEAVPAHIRAIVARTTKTGHRCKPCRQVLSKDEVLVLADAGVALAKQWAIFQGWRADVAAAQAAPAVNAAGADAPAAPALSPQDCKELHQLHLLAGASTAMSFRSLSAESWTDFFGRLTGGSYKPPSRRQVSRLLEQLGALCDAAVDRALRPRGPWALVTDGASGGDAESFLNFLAVSPQDLIVEQSWQRLVSVRLPFVAYSCWRVFCILDSGFSRLSLPLGDS